MVNYMKDNINIIKAKYVRHDKSVIDVTLNINEDTIVYSYIPNSNDTSPVTLWLNDNLDYSIVSPYDGPSLRDIITCDLKSKRNFLLSTTDKYLTIPDYPLNDSQKEEIKRFRQSLRDITKQEGFPENVIWPEVPVCIKHEVNIPS